MKTTDNLISKGKTNRICSCKLYRTCVKARNTSTYLYPAVCDRCIFWSQQQVYILTFPLATGKDPVSGKKIWPRSRFCSHYDAVPRSRSCSHYDAVPRSRSCSHYQYHAVPRSSSCSHFDAVPRSRSCSHYDAVPNLLTTKRQSFDSDVLTTALGHPPYNRPPRIHGVYRHSTREEELCESHSPTDHWQNGKRQWSTSKEKPSYLECIALWDC